MDICACRGEKWEYSGLCIHIIQPAWPTAAAEHFTEVLAVTVKSVHKWERTANGEGQASKNSSQIQLSFLQ